MKLSQISRRFLFSPKSHSLVNLVAIVSVVAIVVPTAAMIIVLSLQNGLSGLVHDLYSNFDSELRVTPSTGQFFEISDEDLDEIKEFAAVSTTLETSALASYRGSRVLVSLRGVDSLYNSVSNISSTIKRGNWATLHGDRPRAVIGSGAGYNLALTLGTGEYLELSAIIPTSKLPGFWGGAPLLHSDKILPSGVFSVEAQIDSQYIFTDISFVRSLLGKEDVISSLEIKPFGSSDEAKKRIEHILGDEVEVLTRYEQRATIFSAIDTEGVVIFFVLLFVAMIAAMSLGGCTLMMTTEKASSASVLRSLGMSERAVRRVFVALGMRVVTIGLATGLVLGVGLVLIQQYYMPLAAGGDSFIENSYPVSLHLSDILFTTISILVVGWLIIWIAIGRIRFSTVVK